MRGETGGRGLVYLEASVAGEVLWESRWGVSHMRRAGVSVHLPSRAVVGGLNWVGRRRAESRIGEVILRGLPCEG